MNETKANRFLKLMASIFNFISRDAMGESDANEAALVNYPEFNNDGANLAINEMISAAYRNSATAR